MDDSTNTEEMNGDSLSRIRDLAQIIILTAGKEAEYSYNINPRENPQLWEQKIAIILATTLAIASNIIETHGLTGHLLEEKKRIMKKLKENEDRKTE